MAGSAIQSVQSCSDSSDSGAGWLAAARTCSATSGGGMTGCSSEMIASVDPGTGEGVGLLAATSCETPAVPGRDGSGSTAGEGAAGGVSALRLLAVPQPVASSTNASTTAATILREGCPGASAPSTRPNNACRTSSLRHRDFMRHHLIPVPDNCNFFSPISLDTTAFAPEKGSAGAGWIRRGLLVRSSRVVASTR